MILSTREVSQRVVETSSNRGARVGLKSLVPLKSIDIELTSKYLVTADSGRQITLPIMAVAYPSGFSAAGIIYRASFRG